jgi:hypothetical protein
MNSLMAPPQTFLHPALFINDHRHQRQGTRMTIYLNPEQPQRISWGAIFAGCFISLVAYLVLSVLGTAIGASAIDPLGDANPLSGFGKGTGIWLGVTTLVSILIGAFIAGRSAPGQGGLHGVLSWSLTTLITTYLVASLASGIAGAATGAVGKGLSLAGDGVAAAAPHIASGVKDELQKNGISFDSSDLQNQLDTLLRQTGKPELDPSNLKATAQQATDDGKQTAQQTAATPQQTDQQLSDWFARVRQEGQPALNAADKDALVNIVAARTGKSHDEAQQIVDNYAQTYQQAMAKFQQVKQEAEQKAREAADATARGVSKAAWGALVLLLVGGLIAFVAGVFGFARRPVPATVVKRPYEVD